MLNFVSNHLYLKLLLPEGSNDLGTIRRLTAGAMAGITSVGTSLTHLLLLCLFLKST